MLDDDFSLNLATLPPDIIKNIIRVDDESMDTKRLISHSWNASVLSYLADLRYKPTLERVYLAAANEADFDETDDDETAPNAREHVCMWVMVPGNCSRARIGQVHWLKTLQTLDNARELTCTPLKILTRKDDVKEVKNPPKPSFRPPLFAVVAGTCELLNRGGYVALLGTTFFAASTAIDLYRTFTDNPKISQSTEVDQQRKAAEYRLTRFFSSFSQIDLLELDGAPHYLELQATLKTFGNLRIKKLKISCYEFNEPIQKSLTELVQKHRIEHISMRISFLGKKTFGDFIKEMDKSGSVLDIYEVLRLREPNRNDSFFHRSRDYWDKKGSELEQEGISLKISCKDDEIFDSRLTRHPHYLRTHLKLMSVDKRGNGVNYSLADDEIRGYRR